ncbi:lanthionine synthetase LanC family protein [Streptomyces sp. NPDC053493]|uniref:lanthionine synthetase LanC family protein n=1 Tax=Streptomyces sp. NPDC053493 TaxID=3365705 RepID=UPI0037D1AE90
MQNERRVKRFLLAGHDTLFFDPAEDGMPDTGARNGGRVRGRLLGGRFRVTGELGPCRAGDVYTAEDTARGGRTVVLKEACPHTGQEDGRHDAGSGAAGLLAEEWAFLNLLVGTGRFPLPVARFTQGEHHYLAAEFVEGADVHAVLLARNPLTRPAFDVACSRDFLRLFLAVFRSLALAVRAAHDRCVVLGDLTADHLLLDPDSHEVTVVGLEACRLAGSVEGDLHDLATTMAQLVFPVAAVPYHRAELLDTSRILLDGLGWPPRVHELLTGLATARIGLTDLVEALDEALDEALEEALDEDERGLLDQVRAPALQPVHGSVRDAGSDTGAVDPEPLARAEAGVAAFVTAVADTDRATLFPVDPFAHVTNPLSLGFGAGGVLWALHASGVPVRREWHDWLRERLDGIDLRAYPDGLMSGLAGLAWSADRLGLGTQAKELLDHANRRAHACADLNPDHTFYYGLSGLGMTNLRFHLHGRDRHHLAAARRCADALSDTVRREGGLAYWLNAFVAGRPLTGLGFGQAGVALFLLRMHQVTGEERYLRLGRDALAWEIDRARPAEDGDADGNGNGTGTWTAAWDGDGRGGSTAGGPGPEGAIEPYAGADCAGVAQVLLRYGDLDAARTVLRGLPLGHRALPGYASGISGVADALLDATEFTGDRAFRAAALRRLDFVRKVFLFQPDRILRVPREDDRPAPLAVPGEGLLRCATDYLTGSAGVLRVLHRARTGGTADFLLDEVAR